MGKDARPLDFQASLHSLHLILGGKGLLKFQREKASQEFFAEALPLLTKHYLEISANQDIALEPDYEKYAQLDELDMLRVYTARDENALLGYAVFFIHQNLHYKSSKQALQDVLYIDKDRRGFGAKFILWCDKQLKADACQVVYHHVKAKHNFGPMLERLGYGLVDLIYSKRLDKETE